MSNGMLTWKTGGRHFFQNKSLSSALYFIIQFTISNIFSKKYNFIIQKTSFIVAKTITMLFYKKGTINLGNNTKKFENNNTNKFCCCYINTIHMLFATINEVF